MLNLTDTVYSKGSLVSCVCVWGVHVMFGQVTGKGPCWLSGFNMSSGPRHALFSTRTHTHLPLPAFQRRLVMKMAYINSSLIFFQSLQLPGIAKIPRHIYIQPTWLLHLLFFLIKQNLSVLLKQLKLCLVNVLYILSILNLNCREYEPL